LRQSHIPSGRTAPGTGSHRALLRLAAAALRHAPVTFAAWTLVTLASGVMPGMTLWATRGIVNGIRALYTPGAGGGARTGLHVWLAVVVAAWLLTQLLVRIDRLLETALRERLGFSLQADVLAACGSCPLAVFEQPVFQDRLQRARPMMGGRLTSLIRLSVMVARSGAAVLTYTALLCGHAPWLGLTVLGCAVPATYYRTVRTQMGNRRDARLVRSERLGAYLRGLLTRRETAKEVRLFLLLPHLSDRWEREYGAYWRSMLGDALAGGGLSFLAGLTLLAGYTVVLAVLVRQVADGEITLGTFTVLAGAALALQVQLDGVLRQGTQIARDLPSLGALFAVVDAGAPAPEQARRGAVDPAAAVCFEGVGFTYPGARQPALRDFTFRLEPGETVAIVGPNGSGKSTLVQLLLGLYAPTAGRVLRAGVDSRSVPLDQWTASMAAVFQDPAPIRLRVREAIGFGDEDLERDDAVLGEAGAAAGLFAAEAPPLDLLLDPGRGGTDLSGGQWQRLGLARALARRARTLVLDEPAAALDPDAEAELYGRFRDLGGRRTTVLVSHRLGAVRCADRIVVLHAGRMVQTGTHDELARAPGLYRDLWEAQSGWYSGAPAPGGEPAPAAPGGAGRIAAPPPAPRPAAQAGSGRAASLRAGLMRRGRDWRLQTRGVGNTLTILCTGAPLVTLSLACAVLAAGAVPALVFLFERGLLDAVLGAGPALYWLAGLVAVRLVAAGVAEAQTPLRRRLVPVLEERVVRDLIGVAAGVGCERFEDPEFAAGLDRAGRVPGVDVENTVWGLFQLLQGMVGVAGLTVVLARLGWGIPLLVALGGLASMAVESRFELDQYYLDLRQTPEQRDMAVYEALLTDRQAAKEVRLYRARDALLLRWRSVFTRLRAQNRGLRRGIYATFAAADLGHALLLGGALLWLLHDAAAGGRSAGSYVAGLTALLSAEGAWGAWAQGMGRMQGHMQRQQRDLFAFVQRWRPAEERHPADEQGGGAGESPPLGIELRGVSFAYPGAAAGTEPVLSRISLRIPPGQHVALVGANGAGKSTLARVLLGLYLPTAGQVLHGGRDVAAATEEDRWRRGTAVFQDFVRYDLTARENVGFGRVARLHDDGALWAAARKGGADGLVEGLPGRWETWVGPTLGGRDLSGGEWQRLAASRAFLREARLMVLDEPTSALDPAIEREMYERFERLAEGCTAVLISHRLGWARRCDRVLVLDRGRVVEDGTHDDLVASGGVYAHMWATQAQWYQ